MIHINRKIRSATLAVAMGFVLHPIAHAGAAVRITSDAEQFAAAQPEALRPLFKALYIEGEHNAVLNLDYLGLAAMEQGEYTTAERAFDAAIGRIEAIYANNPSAQKAKSLFAAEKVKDFKGEPYERAMTYYYRGILYIRAGDYQNARASFLAAEWQSTLSESESYESSFGLMEFLAAWASYCDGDEARGSDLHARAASVQPAIFSDLPPKATFLGVVDLGIGPTKYGIGQYQERLAFKPSEAVAPFQIVDATVVGANPPVIAGDVNWQAETRSGRPVDAILNGKAQWKANTDAVSSAMTTVGYAAALQGAYSNNNSLAQMGTIGMVAGLAGSFFSRAMTPAADTRSWASLPAAIAVETGQLHGSGVPVVSFQYGDPASTGSTVLNARAGKCALSWGRTRSSLRTALEHVRAPVAEESRHEAINAQFRSMLLSTFAAATAATAAN
jgi:tetratricopeptide (TPR) repeat protein